MNETFIFVIRYILPSFEKQFSNSVCFQRTLYHEDCLDRSQKFVKNICLINLAYFTRYVWQQSFEFLGAFEASSPFPRDAETTQVAEYKQSPTRRTEWIGENESNEYVRRVTTKTMDLAAIGVSLEREISKCFNLFETPRLLIVRSVDSTCPSRSSYRPSRSTFSFYRPLSSLRLLSLSNYTFLFPFKRSSCSFLHFIHFSGFCWRWTSIRLYLDRF